MPNSQQTPSEKELPKNYRPLKGSERVPRRGAVRLGPADPNEIVLVSIYVRPRTGSPPLPNHDYYAATPVGKRERLSRSELAVRYGASPEDLKVVTDFAQASGLKVVEKDAARRLVQLSGTVAQLSKAFAVELALYRSPKRVIAGAKALFGCRTPLLMSLKVYLVWTTGAWLGARGPAAETPPCR